jgi:dephospho-CoA kinase
MGAGKSSVADQLKARHQFSIRSFGDVVRAEATARGLAADSRTVLQDLGQELISSIGPKGMVERVLARSSTRLAIDGVRHPQVLTELTARLPDLVFVYLVASDDSLSQRWRSRGDQASRPAVSGHAVEAEVAQLQNSASLVIRTEAFSPEAVADVIASAAR